MAITVKESFEKFASNLIVTDQQVNLVSTRRSAVVDALGAKVSLHTSTPSLLTGSYDRHTLTRYLNEGDVDVMVVLHYGDNKHWDTPSGATSALDEFKRILDDKFSDVPKRRDRNCITLRYDEFRLDVVPAFRFEGGYYHIPDSMRGQWLDTDPIRFQEKVSEVNKTMDGKFVPLIKMIKGWNRHVGWPIRSFHLECMMLNRYQTYLQGFTYQSMVKVFFEALPGYLEAATYDPIMGDRVDTYLDNSSTRTRSKAIRLAKDAAEKSAEAYEDETFYPHAKDISIREWKALMGEFFPSYG